LKETFQTKSKNALEKLEHPRSVEVVGCSGLRGEFFLKKLHHGEHGVLKELFAAMVVEEEFLATETPGLTPSRVVLTLVSNRAIQSR
jgi:hypothetical protein